MHQNPLHHSIFKCIIFLAFNASWFFSVLYGQSIENKRIEGYRAIWFELNQKYEYGDKYSGALGTYTAKHHPLALYSKEADKTFFVYGGTKSENSKHLLCMIGAYDHASGKVLNPWLCVTKWGLTTLTTILLFPLTIKDTSGYLSVEGEEAVWVLNTKA